MTTQTQPLDVNAAARIQTRVGYGLLAALIIYTAVALFYRLDQWPRPWYNDGSYMKVAKNFALNGVYADFSVEGNFFTGTVISVGPTVILPVAAVFKWFGVSIVGGRLIIAAYSLLTLFMLWKLCAALKNRQAAYVAVVLLLLVPNYLEYSRQVHGEVPGLFFIFAGLWLWASAGARSVPRLIGAGVLFGLASITKNQFAVIILPSLLLAWILDLVWYRKRGWLYFVVPGAVAGLIFFAWTAYLLFGLGSGAQDATADRELLRVTTTSTFFMFSPSRNIDNLLKLTTEGLGIFIIPTLLYLFVKSSRHSEQGQHWGNLLIASVIGIGLYVFSNGNTRYAFPAVGLLIPGMAGLIVDSLNGLVKAFKEWRLVWLGRPLPELMSVSLLACGVVLIVFLGVARLQVYETSLVFRGGGDDLVRVGQYLNATVQPDKIIETWEAELAVVTDHRYHFPPTSVLIDWVITRNVSARYDFRDFINADYVVIGIQGRDTAIYTPERLADFDLIQTIGIYSIYQKRMGS